MEQQLAVARQFQRLFMPPALPAFPQARFAVKYQPSPRVGGDLYDVCDMGNSCVGFLVADAAGNGLSATLITAIAKIAFDTFRQNEYSPKVILERMNRQIVRNTLEDQFLTAFLGILDLETLRLKFVNASHTCPVLYGPKRFELLDTEGLCCGMFEEPRYEEKEIQLQAGDRLLLLHPRAGAHVQRPEPGVPGAPPPRAPESEPQPGNRRDGRAGRRGLLAPHGRRGTGRGPDARRRWRWCRARRKRSASSSRASRCSSRAWSR